MEQLKDYSNRCGSCKFFSFLVTKGSLRWWGFCERKDRANYHQASQKACLKYEEDGEND